MESNRKNDSIVEREIAKFLDEWLYSDTSLFKEFARTDGIDEQLKGSDIILSTCNGALKRSVVDEKVAARFANTSLDSFALELSFIGRNGDRLSGWFIDNSKVTEYYLLGWIVRADIPFNVETNRYDTDRITRDNIMEMDWALVSRKSIMGFLEERGWNIEKLALQDNRIRENGGVRTKEFINGVSFRYSDSYAEKPINILLKKETYMRLSVLNGKIVRRDEEDGVSNKIILRSKIVNDKYTQYLYDNYDIQNKEITTTEVPIPSSEDVEHMNGDDWNILLICGKSGSGKSTILRKVYGDVRPISYEYDKAVISQFPRLSEEEACDLLSSMGLSSVPTWLRKPNELSNGERARLDIAKAIYDSDGRLILIDEYTSVVNRHSAMSMSYALQRYVREKNLKIIIASCHFDIIEWLQPDYIFNLEHRDEHGDVELEKILYNDDVNYNAFQSVKEADSLSEAMEVNL